ncbi:MAG TPA: SOS response-associated peptidase [Opitutaceae bacterium]|nr:SOS response-associated peptidase [Opitutaceae bacterium]
MCGRYVLKREDLEALVREFGLHSLEEWHSRYNVAPTSVVPLIRRSRSGQPTREAGAGRAGDGEPAVTPAVGLEGAGAPGPGFELAGVRWGLIPAWTKPDAPVKPLVNLRAETLTSRFKGALRSRRCIVPASGFYEWEAVGGLKQPWFFQPREGGPIGFAGIWDAWRSAEGTELETCTIVTTTPNALLEPIHNRMPVILTPAQCRTWLEAPADDVERLLAPSPAESLVAHRVGAAVSSVRNDGPECVVPGTVGPAEDAGPQLSLGI